jgi:hypothetical protein
MDQNKIGVDMKAIDIADWEDAIDYSWDHDVEDVDSNATIEEFIAVSEKPHEHYLLVEQQRMDDTSSSASTPLMMQAPHRPLPACPGSQAQQVRDEAPSPLLGLGIEPMPSPTAPVDLTQTANDAGKSRTNEATGESGFYSHSPRSPHSHMSKSSSQESIILSVTSSIIGTYRSSNSSTSLSDFAHLAHFGESFDKSGTQPTSPSMDLPVREGSQETVREEAFMLFDTITGHPVLGSDDVTTSSHITIPERTSSMPGLERSKYQLDRKKSGTLSPRARRNTRVSYSLFPTAQ